MIDGSETTSPDARYPDALPAGTMIGGFAITRVIGAGGFGITYEGYNRVTKRRVAIKEFFPQGSRRERDSRVVFSQFADDVVTWALERFESTTTRLCELEHPNIVKVFDYLPMSGTGYMVMEYLDGTTLQGLVRERGPLNPAALRPILEPVLDALAYVHGTGLVHRDIAPDNIVVTRSGRPVLIDFGAVSRDIGTMSRAVVTRGIEKAGFTAPEQAVADARPEPSADLYSLGAVLYHALTGRAPESGSRRSGKVHLYGEDDPLEPLAALRLPGVDPRTAALVDSCLALRRAERPNSVVALREGLGWGGAPPQPPPPPWEPPVDPVDHTRNGPTGPLIGTGGERPGRGGTTETWIGREAAGRLPALVVPAGGLALTLAGLVAGLSGATVLATDYGYKFIALMFAAFLVGTGGIVLALAAARSAWPPGRRMMLAWACLCALIGLSATILGSFDGAALSIGLFGVLGALLLARGGAMLAILGFPGRWPSAEWIGVRLGAAYCVAGLLAALIGITVAAEGVGKAVRVLSGAYFLSAGPFIIAFCLVAAGRTERRRLLLGSGIAFALIGAAAFGLGAADVFNNKDVSVFPVLIGPALAATGIATILLSTVLTGNERRWRDLVRAGGALCVCAVALLVLGLLLKNQLAIFTLPSGLFLLEAGSVALALNTLRRPFPLADAHQAPRRMA